jgi:hypothetical protein
MEEPSQVRPLANGRKKEYTMKTKHGILALTVLLTAAILIGGLAACGGGAAGGGYTLKQVSYAGVSGNDRYVLTITGASSGAAYIQEPGDSFVLVHKEWDEDTSSVTQSVPTTGTVTGITGTTIINLSSGSVEVTNGGGLSQITGVGGLTATVTPATTVTDLASSLEGTWTGTVDGVSAKLIYFGGKYIYHQTDGVITKGTVAVSDTQFIFTPTHRWSSNWITPSGYSPEIGRAHV